MIKTMESVTAKLCSFARAYHSGYAKQKIFDDYLAFDMMGREEYEEIGQLIESGFCPELCRPDAGFKGERVYPLLDEHLSPIPLSRIAYAEQELADFAAQNGRCQYVICGAGMDTFAFRNGNPDILIFELDHPDTQRYKLERVRRLSWNIPENVRYVAIDFTADEMEAVLTASGYDPALPAFFSILGVTYYLKLPEFGQTVGHISALSAKGNRIVFDYPDETTFQQGAPERVRLLSEVTAKLGEPMKQGYAFSDMEQALGRHRFAVGTHLPPREIQKRFFEGRSDGQRAFENVHFISAIKR